MSGDTGKGSSGLGIGGGVEVDRVDRWFLRDWSKWPLTVAMERGGYFFKEAALRPGKLVR
jgi:hypothetical protein